MSKKGNQDKSELSILYQQFKSRKITVAEFAKRLQEHGENPDFWLNEKERVRLQKIGNESGNGFLHNCYTDERRGMFYQTIIKKVILKAIDFAHSSFIKQYDKDVYVYGDERLKALDKFGKRFISVYFTHAPGYKDKFMLKILDFTLGHSKQDIYYRARMLKGANKFYLWMKENYPDGFPLTEPERCNIEEYH